MSIPMLSLAALLVTSSALAGETAGQKAREVTTDTGNATKKGVHRIGEQLCTGSKAECEARKARNRLSEKKDAVRARTR